MRRSMRRNNSWRRTSGDSGTRAGAERGRRDASPYRGDWTVELQRYLQEVLRAPVRIMRTAPLGDGASPKQFGYGSPLRIDAEVDGIPRSLVLSTLSPGRFGHEHMADRAQAVLWSHAAYGALPRHVRSVDAGAFLKDGRMLSAGEAAEFFLVTEFVEGRAYFEDLRRIGRTGKATALDLDRARALSEYLVDIHRTRGPDPGLYVRRIRELVGHGECIMGIADSFPPSYAQRLKGIEEACVRWRWKLRGGSDRLRQVHGDFHPWNVLFREGTDFSVLDRSRGEWGEPADDVCCMAMNYIFASLRRSGRLEGGFADLFRAFWSRYREAAGDAELEGVAAPFLVFRALVMASPVWYPRLAKSVREQLLAFAENVLDRPRFDPERVNAYCGP